jgi:SPP1 family predicted phage head-tail adaptor
MQAGRLRHRVTLQSYSESLSALGEPLKTWTDLATVWADVSPERGKEAIAAMQINASVMHRVRIRYREGLTPKMRVVFGTRTLQVEAVLNVDERDRELLLVCVEAA